MSNIEIATGLLNDFTAVKVKELFEERPWMVGKKFLLLSKQIEVEEYVSKCIESGLCTLDVETTGLNTRRDPEGNPYIKLIGICLAYGPDEGAYIPIAHEDKEFNVPLKFMVKELARLVANCRCIYHNFKYDGQVLRNHGIIIEDDDKYEDTLLLAAVYDASMKKKGLKELSEGLLNRPMLEISELGVKSGKKGAVALELVPPQKAVYYGASDGMNTYALYQFLKAKVDEQDPTGKNGPWAIYKVEKRCQFVTMEMERNYARIDKKYLEQVREDVIGRMKKLIQGIYELVGREFDLNSPKQLGPIIFEEMSIPYPKGEEKTASGQYGTSEEVLEKLQGKYPIVDMILAYRGYGKVLGTYIENFIKNADENDEVKFQLNQVRADTGRFSSTGGRGLLVDGYSGVNCQNIPKHDEKDPNSIDLRKAIIARPGYKLVSIDYSGEELRIAANLSREPKWIEEFLHGTGDLHTITAKIITGKDKIDKNDRQTGKTLNFLTMYGGGAGGFAAQAKIPYETAQKMIANFFRDYTGLKRWIAMESARSRKRGYSKTALGRRRPLLDFYSSPDRINQAKGDRCAVNSAVQGCLQPHERVLINRGYLSIHEVENLKKSNSDLLVWTGSSWADFSVVDRGIAQYAQIVLINGMYIDCDTRHEVLIVGKNGYEFKHYNNLTKMDRVCVSIPTEKKYGSYPEKTVFDNGIAPNFRELRINSDKDWDFVAYAIGYFIGDGHLRSGTPRKSITFSFGIEKLKRNYDNLKSGFEKMGIKLSEPKISKGSIGESYTCRLESKSAVELFEYMGCSQADARNKRVPEKIFSSPLSMRKAFLKGYYDTDACKKKANRYNIHTPNRELLREVQMLAWTLGLSSAIMEASDNTYQLNWSDLGAFEKYMGLDSKSCLTKRTCSRMLLPSFLYDSIYQSLKSCGRSMDDQCDRVLLCKLHKHKPVAIQTVQRLLDKYDCDQPEMYYHYNLKRKKALKTTGHTFTLSVQDPGHRFDSAGIISKNTGADIIKVALYRVWKWIHGNNLADDIRVLIPLHDEILYEIKEDKLDAYVPELCEIMKLKDVVQNLKWPVPLEVDAEYGDSFHADHNYWEEHQQSTEERKEEKPQEKAQEGEQTPAPVAPEKTAPVEKTPVVSVIRSDSEETVSSTVNNEVQQYYCHVTVKSALTGGAEARDDIKRVLEKSGEHQKSDSIFQDAHIKDRIDPRGYFNYPLDIDSVVARQLRYIFDLLISAGDSVFTGPKYRICLLNKEGEVYYKTAEEVSIDAFLALCLTYNI